MRDTVFSPAFGNRPSQLVGRDAVISALLAGLDSNPGSKERATLLLGQRGTGKTVLLWELADRARDKGWVVATPTVTSENMLARIVEKIQDDGSRHLDKQRAKLVGGSVGAFGFSAGLEFSREVQETKSDQYKLLSLCRRLTELGHGTLILVDEAQARIPELKQLIIAYQELVGEGLDVAMVMAGLPAAISATLNDHVLTFFNRAKKIRLEPLAIADVDAFFEQAFEELGLTISPEIRKRAARATSGSPYMLQLVGHNLVVYAKSDQEVDESSLQNAIETSREEFMEDVCKTTIASLSERDVDFLCAMSHDPDQSGGSRMMDVAERMGVTPDYAQKYRRRLIEAGIIDAPRRGVVRFAVPYLADYLRSESAF